MTESKGLVKAIDDRAERIREVRDALRCNQINRDRKRQELQVADSLHVELSTMLASLTACEAGCP